MKYAYKLMSLMLQEVARELVREEDPDKIAELVGQARTLLRSGADPDMPNGAAETANSIAAAAALRFSGTRR